MAVVQLMFMHVYPCPLVPMILYYKTLEVELGGQRQQAGLPHRSHSQCSKGLSRKTSPTEDNPTSLEQIVSYR